MFKSITLFDGKGGSGNVGLLHGYLAIDALNVKDGDVSDAAYRSSVAFDVQDRPSVWTKYLPMTF